MWLDDLAETALYVLPALIVGAAAVRVIFGHPAFWVYLVAVAIAGALIGTMRRLFAKRRGRKSSGP